jgi:L-asparagine transporter-like permease
MNYDLTKNELQVTRNELKVNWNGQNVNYESWMNIHMNELHSSCDHVQYWHPWYPNWIYNIVYTLLLITLQKQTFIFNEFYGLTCLQGNMMF